MKKFFFLLIFSILFVFGQAMVWADGKVQKTSEEMVAGDPPSVETKIRFEEITECNPRQVPGYLYVEEGNSVYTQGPLLMSSTYIRRPVTWTVGVTRWGCHKVWVEEHKSFESEESGHE